MPQHFRPYELEPEQAPDEDDEPPATYYAQQVARLEQQLQHHAPTDPELRAGLERDLAAWRRELEATQREEHWRAGEGDRTLW